MVENAFNASEPTLLFLTGWSPLFWTEAEAAAEAEAPLVEAELEAGGAAAASGTGCSVGVRMAWLPADIIVQNSLNCKG